VDLYILSIMIYLYLLSISKYSMVSAFYNCNYNVYHSIAGWRGGGGARARAARRKIHGEDSEFAGYIRVREGVLTPDAEVALAVAEDGGAEELIPRGGSDGERSDNDGTCPVCASLGHEGIEEGGREEGEVGLAVQLVAVGTAGAGPVWHHEGVLGLRSRFGIAGEKPGEEGIRLRSKGVDSELPVEAPDECLDPLAEERSADWPGDLEGAGAGKLVHAFLYEGASRGMQEQGVASDPMLEAAGAHGTLLQEGGRETALPKGRQGADRVVTHDDPCISEVDLEGSGLDGERASEGLAADLVGHVLRVG
jgi:hypothetical protein